MRLGKLFRFYNHYVEELERAVEEEQWTLTKPEQWLLLKSRAERAYSYQLMLKHGFTIAKDVKKSKLRPYIQNFLRFRNEEDKELYASIRKQNVLIVDDVTTSGSTLGEILRTLRIINEDNEITVFSLIGRKDLMAEA